MQRKNRFLDLLAYLFNFDYQKRLIPKKTFCSAWKAKEYILKVHRCWGGGEIDINLYYDICRSVNINQTERIRLLKLLRF